MKITHSDIPNSPTIESIIEIDCKIIEKLKQLHNLKTRIQELNLLRLKPEYLATTDGKKSISEWLVTHQLLSMENSTLERHTLLLQSRFEEAVDLFGRNGGNTQVLKTALDKNKAERERLLLQ